MKALRNTLLLLTVGTMPFLARGFSPRLVETSTVLLPSRPDDLVLPFSITVNTQIPDKVLRPGRYTIRLLDHLSDRMVLRVENGSGETQAVFLGLPTASLGGPTGPVPWANAGKQAALRGFVFPNGGAVEFVYPKDQAVQIAKATSMKVAAVDPVSEGMHPAVRDLSPENRQLVTLWLLSPTRVGSEAAIQAERYTPPAQKVETAQGNSSSPAWTATNGVAVANNAPAPVRHKASATAPSAQIAAVRRPALVPVLPHTGSDLPAIMLSGIVLLCLAGGVRLMRLPEA